MGDIQWRVSVGSGRPKPFRLPPIEAVGADYSSEGEEEAEVEEEADAEQGATHSGFGEHKEAARAVKSTLTQGVSKLKRALSYVYSSRGRGASDVEVGGAGAGAGALAWDEEDGWGAIHRSAMGTITAFAI